MSAEFDTQSDAGPARGRVSPQMVYYQQPAGVQYMQEPGAPQVQYAQDAAGGYVYAQPQMHGMPYGSAPQYPFYVQDAAAAARGLEREVSRCLSGPDGLTRWGMP